MAYLTIARFPGDPQVLLEAYRRSADVMSGVGRDYGLVLHAAAKADDGRFRAAAWRVVAIESDLVKVIQRTAPAPGSDQ